MNQRDQTRNPGGQQQQQRGQKMEKQQQQQRGQKMEKQQQQQPQRQQDGGDKKRQPDKDDLER